MASYDIHAECPVLRLERNHIAGKWYCATRDAMGNWKREGPISFFAAVQTARVCLAHPQGRARRVVGGARLMSALRK